MPGASDRDRDPAGRARNARLRDDLGRPLPRTAGSTAAGDEPALPPADALARAQSLLDTDRAFTAHEVLEAVWKATSGPDRGLWRGLAQICVGITHSLRGNASGAAALLQRATETLAPYAGTTPHGIDVDGLRDWASAASGDLTLTAKPPRLTGNPT
jgi:hypothetical protein